MKRRNGEFETLDSLADRLGNVSHFMKLPLADRFAIVSAGQMRLITAGSVIFTENTPCAGMFVLLRGHVHICKLGPQGQENIIADLNPVIMFNEVALLDGGPNPYTAIADQNCLVWQIGCDAYNKLLMRFAQEPYMQVSLGLLRIMAGRYRQLVENYADLSFLTVPVRVAKLVFELSNNGNHPINRREISINEMAARTATVPEAISRSLNFLKCQGIIETTRTLITIKDPAALAHLAQIEADIF
jgi:CRP-like cAMP-binding protein